MITKQQADTNAPLNRAQVLELLQNLRLDVRTGYDHVYGQDRRLLQIQLNYHEDGFSKPLNITTAEIAFIV